MDINKNARRSLSRARNLCLLTYFRSLHTNRALLFFVISDADIRCTLGRDEDVTQQLIVQKPNNLGKSHKRDPTATLHFTFLFHF